MERAVRSSGPYVCVSRKMFCSNSFIFDQCRKPIGCAGVVAKSAGGDIGRPRDGVVEARVVLFNGGVLIKIEGGKLGTVAIHHI